MPSEAGTKVGSRGAQDMPPTPTIVLSAAVHGSATFKSAARRSEFAPARSFAPTLRV